jgi:hypothetical protein
MGGSELITPTQAKVMIFGLPSSFTHVTSTTGVGKRVIEKGSTLLSLFG